MRIVLLGHDDIASLYALARLVAALPQCEFTAFFSGELTGAHDAPARLQALARFDRRLCDALRPQLPAVLREARDLPAPNSAQGLAELRAAAPELIVSVRYRRILRDAAIATAPRGVLNLHSGILPDYKGVMATFWAMLEGEREIGSTLHRITDSGVDTGPVIDIARRPVVTGESYLANVLALYPDGVDMLVEAISDTAAGRPAAGARQASGAGRYFSAPDAAALASWEARGLVLYDGSEAERLVNFPFRSS